MKKKHQISCECLAVLAKLSERHRKTEKAGLKPAKTASDAKNMADEITSQCNREQVLVTSLCYFDQ